MKPISSGLAEYSTPISSVALPPSGLLTESDELVGLDVELDRASALAGDGRDAVDGRLELGIGDLHLLVVALRNDAPVVGEGAVDQLGGERHRADLEAHLGGADADLDGGRAVLDEPVQLVHGLARDDDAGHAGSALGQRQLHLREPVSVGGDRAQRRRLVGLGGVQIDAVQVVARLLGGDGKPRLVDEALQVLRIELELLAQVTDADVGEVLRRQRLQRKARVTCSERQALLLRVLAHVDLGAVGKLAHDVVQHMGGHGDSAGSANLGGDRLDDLALQIGRLELERGVAGAQEHVRQDGNGRPSLDDARDVAERPQEFTTFND